MTGSMKSSMLVFMVLMMVASTTMAQTRHVVGDGLGWTIPSNGAAAYTAWASRQTFTVGDTLFFNFTTGMHNVAEVAQAAYGPCITTNPISLAATGPTTVTLSAAGNHYYICTVGSHCQIGQKLIVNVVAAAAAPATPPTATTPTVSPPTTTPSPSPMTPPTISPTPSPTPSVASPSPSAASPSPSTAPTPSPVRATPPSPSTSSPSPSGSTTLPPTSDTTPSTPSPSAATRSFAAVVPATFLALALFL